MTWLYIFIFMITANVLGNAAAKIGWLTFQGAHAQNQNTFLIFSSAAILLYLKFKFICWLLRKYPRNYEDHTIAFWMFAILPSILYKFYLEVEFEDISALAYPNIQLTSDLIGSAILAFSISHTVFQDAAKAEQKIAQNFREQQRLKEEELTRKAQLPSPRPKNIRSETNLTTSSKANNKSALPDITPTVTKTFTDEHFYKAALDEYDEDAKIPETWAKAITLCKGDEVAAKWKYVELRVEGLVKQHT